jgi:hypothetical protein
MDRSDRTGKHWPARSYDSGDTVYDPDPTPIEPISVIFLDEPSIELDIETEGNIESLELDLAYLEPASREPGAIESK